jgi:hypothetical protein
MSIRAFDVQLQHHKATALPLHLVVRQALTRRMVSEAPQQLAVIRRTPRRKRLGCAERLYCEPLAAFGIRYLKHSTPERSQEFN